MNVDEVLAKMDALDTNEEEIQYIIDENLRVISIPPLGVVLGVEGDKDVNSAKFKMVRYYKGIDLSKFEIRINFANANGDLSYYTVKNPTVTDDTLTFEWLVGYLATKYKGTVRFIVRMITTDSSTGEVQQAFDTTIGKAQSLEGLLVDVPTDEKVYDIVAQLKADLTDHVNNLLETIPEDYNELTKKVENNALGISELKEDLGNLNKEKLNSDVVYEVGDDGEVVSSTKMMDISGNGEIAKISADSVYKDNIIPLTNIAEKIVNGLTYSVKDGIISLNGTATTYTLIDLGVNLSMMDGLSAIGYKIFVLDGTHPSGMSIVLGISLAEYAQTLTNTVQEKKSSSLITFNNKNISISINNNTAVNIKFGVVVIPINDIPSKFNVGKKYTGYMLNQLICTNNMWAFGTNISKIKLAQYYRFRKNKLYGKSLFVVGDSVAFGFGSGGKSYADIIAEKNKMSMKKVAVSGTTFAKRDGLTNSILEQVQTMDKMYDYVLIEGGFNDYFQKDKGVAIGTMPKNMNSSRDDKTTYGALDSICLWLKQKYPSSKLLFVVPHKIMTNTGVLDDGFYPYLQAIRNVCEKYSISYADIALKGGCTPFYQEFRDTYFSGDGIHPNLEGYESFYVPRIEAEMEML